MSKELIRPSQFAHVEASLAETEEHLALSDEQLKELESLYSSVLKHIAPGKLMTATILEIDSNGVLVDIGFKSNGFIPRFEFSEHEFKKLVPGNTIEIIVDQLENADGTVALSYEKAKAIRAWDEITKLFEEGKPVEGTVTHKVKGGLNVDIGIPAFLPGSQIDLQRVTDFDHFVGQTVSAQIIKLNQKRGNVIISRRKFLADQRGHARKQILDTLAEGQVLQGIVKNITNYGAFVDIGGVDGLLHITDMTWGRIAHPSELLKIGQEVTVKILSFDKDNEKISLGMKQLTDNPWAKAAKTIKTGDIIKGTVSTITDYGLFISVAPDVEGLIHISEVSWTDRINDLKDKFKVGDQVEVRVVSFDPENRRMSLSIKQLSENPWERVDKEFKEGQRVKGSVSNITDFGIFVQLLPGIDGLVHISDISWTDHIEHPSDKYKLGDEVEAVVLSVDKDNKKVSLGIKQLTEDPWQSIEKIHPIGSTVEGVVSKITNFGAFVKLPSGVEGLIHKSEVSDENVQNVEDVLKVGQTLEFKVVNLNKEDRKLGLSLRSDEKIKEAKQQRAPKHQQRQPQQQQQAAQQYVRVEPQIRTKNIMQMELERYAARKDDETSSGDKE